MLRTRAWMEQRPPAGRDISRASVGCGEQGFYSCPRPAAAWGLLGPMVPSMLLLPWGRSESSWRMWGL